jgi:hypothetical protein
MNKKGALFHWIGIVLVFVLAFVMLSPIEFGVKAKGDWQLDFLQHNFIEAEKQLADTDELALQVGRKVVLSLASKGGFADTPDCGSSGEVIYWNKDQDFCFLKVDEDLNTEFNFWYKQYDKDANYTISREGNELIGKTDTEIVLGSGNPQFYTVNSGFRVNVGYDFDEYFLLQDQAKKVVAECKSAADLQDCLQKVKPGNWNFGSCLNESFIAQDQKVAFCASSEYTVLDGGVFVPVEYKFGLDFGMN